MNMKVNSHNEWDTLEEVIVGDGFPTTLPTLDYSFKLFFHENIGDKAYQHGNEFVSKRHVEEHAEDIETFVNLLKSFNIIVKRPKVPKRIHTVKTPWWESTIHPALNVRDMAMVVGDTIIESPPTCRYRYFENDLLKHLFLEYFKSGSKWVQAPKPLMLDGGFDLSWIDENNGTRKYYENIRDNNHYMEHGLEIMFDAANCMRLGKHILMNIGNKNQELGAKWLQDTLGNNYNILTTTIADSHIDSCFLPLRPGLAIITKDYVRNQLPSEFSNWDLIHIPMRKRDLNELNQQGLKLASPRIELNVLSISKELILCHPQYEKELNSILKNYKIEAIGTPFRHCEIFGGAHHCTTLDVRRKSRLENYFD